MSDEHRRVPRADLGDTLDFHLSNSPLGIVEWNQDFRVCFWSGLAQDIFGWTEEEMLGKHPSEWRFVHTDDVAAVDQIMDRLLSGGEPRNISANRNYTRDGRIVHCEWYNSVLTDENGELLSVFSLIHDITDRVESEAQLRQLQKMESIGQLTGGVAHDFNNLLTVILGNADLLSEALSGQPDLDRLAAMITAAANRGAELTHRLLSFSRRQALDPRPIDVNRLLEGIRDLLARTLGEQVELELLCDSSWIASIDIGQLESSLLNLCLNARDAMSEGGRLVIESSNSVLDQDYAAENEEVVPGEYVLIAVSDTGTGMTAEQVQQAFEPFFTTKEQGKGTGLGLSMVFGFIKQSNGHIKIYSEPGEGTTVKVYLPRCDAVPDEAVTERQEAADSGGSEKVLVVEDDESLRSFATEELARLGYEVLSACDGPSALAVLEHEDDVDLLFTDVVMPGGMSGRQLAEKARALHPGLKVLYTSGYTENAIVHQGRLDPGVQLLSKPYRRRDLGRRIRQVLSGED